MVVIMDVAKMVALIGRGRKKEVNNSHSHFLSTYYVPCLSILKNFYTLITNLSFIISR